MRVLDPRSSPHLHSEVNVLALAIYCYVYIHVSEAKQS